MKKFISCFMVLLFVSAFSHVSFASDVAPTDKVAIYDNVHSDNVVIINTVVVSADYVFVAPAYILGSTSVMDTKSITILYVIGITTTNDNLSEIKYIAAEKYLKYKWPLIDNGKVNTIAFNKELVEALKVYHKRE